MPQHPDHEQLAAFQAGDRDRRQRSEVEAHLAGCPACAELVASLAQARRRLALLEEPELPPGLHDRLAAAVAAEVAAGEPVRRPTPWYRRPVAWGAAAALLLAALVAPLLDRSGGVRTTAGDAGGGAAQELAQAPQDTAGLPLIRVPGEVSAATVRARLASDARARQALASAVAGTRRSADSGAQGTAAAPKAEGDAAQAGDTPPSAAAGAAPTSTLAGGRPSPTPSRVAPSPAQPAPAAPGGAVDLQACLSAATTAAGPSTTPLAPAFVIEGTYRGRPATVLVTTSAAQPTRVDLWVFPRGACTARPLATERVR